MKIRPEARPDDITQMQQTKPQRFFNDSFARDVLYIAAAAAYADNPQPCLTNRLRGAYVIGKYKADCGPLPFQGFDYCYGFTAVSEFHRAVILSFRGAQNLAQFLMEDFQAVFEKKSPLFGGGKVARYFHDGFNSVWTKGMYRDLLFLRKRHPNYEIWITGHSLGGSMSAIAAHELVVNPLFAGCRIVTVTFSEPRTGDAEFVEAHNRLLNYTYRVVHKNDFMPHWPSNLIGYRQYKYEIFYDNDMKRGDGYRFCKESEDSSCSAKTILNLSPFDHFHYYKHNTIEFGRRGCKIRR
uniref:Lipase_3 domain-containing protein n=1 Tax=Syphacia muris TaxID=451379 RepID=A0A158R5M4_9BILA